MTTRLTANHRHVLAALIMRIVDCPAEAKAEANAYAKAMPVATKIVGAQFPAKDMEVLVKYKVATRDQCVNIRHPDNSVTRFSFHEADAPLVVGDRYTGCHNRIYLSDEKQQKLIEAWADASKVLSDTLSNKRADYKAFVASANTYEQVLEVWPEAIEVEPSIRVNLPATINPAMLARIKADSEARMKAAAKN